MGATTLRKGWVSLPSEGLRITGRFLLAIVFLASAVGKLIGADQFHRFASSFPVISSVDSHVFLYSVIAVEIALAVLLVPHRTAPYGARASFGILLAFTILLMYASQMETQGGCGCFGEFLPDDSIDIGILRNIALLSLAAFVAHVPRAKRDFSNGGNRL